MKNAGYYRKMRLLTYAVGALVVAVMSTACGKKDEGGSVVVTPGGVNSACVGCPTATALLASATGRSQSGLTGGVSSELSLQFYGDSTTLNGIQQGQSSNMYRGNVVAGGVFRNREARTLVSGGWYGGSGCNLPIGDYALSTTSPGQWYGEMFSTIDLVSTSGPVGITIRMNNNSVWSAIPAAVDYAGAQFPYRMYSVVDVTSLQGGTCRFYIEPYSSF